MRLEPHCASERHSFVRSPRQRCVGEGCGRQARSCREFFAEASQDHAAMSVRKLHLHPFLIRETCYTDDVAHAADQRVLNLVHGCRKQVPPCVMRSVGLAVLQAIVQHAQLFLWVQRQPD